MVIVMVFNVASSSKHYHPRMLCPVCCVITICHKVHCMHWGLFHRTMFPLNCLKMICGRFSLHIYLNHIHVYIFYVFEIWSSRLQWRFIVVLTQNPCVFMFVYINDNNKSGGNMETHGYLWTSCKWPPGKYIRFSCCPASRTTLVATRFRVAVICPIIQVPRCIRVFFYFVWFVFINHIFQSYNELCTYCNILDIYLSWKLNFVNYVLFYMKLLNYLFFGMFGSVLESCELTGVCLLLPWLIKWK